MYTLQGVERRYGDCHVLQDITCTIPTNELVVMTGPSGAGKSTLVRLLSFIEVPDRGSVHLQLNGSSFDSIRHDRPWPRVTCVFQRQFLWPHLTLLENLRLPLRATNRTDADARIAKVIELFAMAAFIHRYPNEVSGGQAQRVALARALVLGPEVILIDEPHGGLDLEQQSILNEHLLQLRSSGVGLIIVTHSLDFLRRYADTIVTVENGTVAAVTSKETFLQPNSRCLKPATDVTTTEGQS
jgi:ABC-type sulfate/molybdate transport systems ATPase subunit